MNKDTLSVTNHLACKYSITKFGGFLRGTKLDELRGVLSARLGITCLAQVNEIDMSTPVLLAKIEAKMLASLTIADYFKYIFMTVFCSHNWLMGISGVSSVSISGYVRTI